MSIWFRDIILKHELSTKFQYNLSKITYFLSVWIKQDISIKEKDISTKLLLFWIKVRRQRWKHHSSWLPDSSGAPVLSAKGQFSSDTVGHPSHMKQFPHLDSSYLNDCSFPISFLSSHFYHCLFNIEEPWIQLLNLYLSIFILGDLN